ncbi:MAG: hypothetical protein IKD41_00985, partial [Alistipes sp.]|nr:hypothetical protein [Alistipes sp.]
MIHDFIKKYAFERFVNSSVIATIDILMSLIAAVITIACVDIIAPISIPMHYVLQVVSINIVATVIAVLLMRTHRIIIRHSTIGDIWKLGAATLIKEAIMVAGVVLILGFKSKVLPLLILFDMLLTFSLLVSVRILMVVVYDS